MEFLLGKISETNYNEVEL